MIQVPLKLQLKNPKQEKQITFTRFVYAEEGSVIYAHDRYPDDLTPSDCTHEICLPPCLSMLAGQT